MFKKLHNYLPSLSQCWVIVFFIIVVGGLGVGTLLSAISGAAGFNIADMNPLLSYILPLLPALAYIFLAKGSGMGSVPIERKTGSGIPAILLYPILAYMTIALGYVSEPLASWLPMPDSVKQIFEKILSNSAWAFATTVIAAPVIEEFLLRGIMERGLLAHTTPLKAILWSAFFFAIIHMNPWQATGAFIAGIWIGWIYWKTGFLIACIFMHAVNNGTAYLIQFLNPELPPESTYKDLLDMHSPNLYSIVFVIFAVSLAVLAFYLNRNLSGRCLEQQENQ